MPNKVLFTLLITLQFFPMTILFSQNLGRVYCYNVDEYVSKTNDSTSESYEKFALGVSFSYSKKYKEAVCEYRKAIAQGNLHALNNYAVVCGSIMGIIDTDTMRSIFTRCANNGVLKSYSGLINLTVEPSERDLLKKAASQKGNTVAQSKLAFSYKRRKLYDSAFFWYKRVIEERVKEVDIEDEMQLTYNGLQINWLTDFSCFNMRYENKNLKGLYYYIRGNKSRGKRLLTKSIRNNKESAKNLAIIYDMEGKYCHAIDILKNYMMESDDIRYLYIANIIHKNQHYPVSEMITYYKLAAGLGNDVAKYNLAVCYLKGLYVPKDTLKAKEYLYSIKERKREAMILIDRLTAPNVTNVVDLNSVQSDEFKSICLYNCGKYTEAIDAFKKILQTCQSSIYANYYMGLCYEKGYGTQIDKDKALEFYHKAGFPSDLPIIM
ncbi:MAG: sel1 repeat family protein [Paludibacteraceae bacterium]|nr:sel1 repeat family protein [Paludibacteraceae bacterium]